MVCNRIVRLPRGLLVCCLLPLLQLYLSFPPRAMRRCAAFPLARSSGRLASPLAICLEHLHKLLYAIVPVPRPGGIGGAARPHAQPHPLFVILASPHVPACTARPGHSSLRLRLRAVACSAQALLSNQAFWILD